MDGAARVVAVRVAEGRPDLRLEVSIACVVLMLAKLVTIAVPILFKWVTDLLASGQHSAGKKARRVALGMTA